MYETGVQVRSLALSLLFSYVYSIGENIANLKKTVHQLRSELANSKHATQKANDSLNETVRSPSKCVHCQPDSYLADFLLSVLIS